jgi:DNA polymerase-3 subunit delta'
LQHYDLQLLQWNSAIRVQLLGQGLGRLPHATLLVGPAGVGKSAFAEQLAALLLCESIAPELTACGQCEACRWLYAGNHPDLRRVAPDGDDDAEGDAVEKPTEKAKKRSASIIRIDQIRELEAFVFVGSHRDGNRVVLVTEADAMNPAAANALLKILEEPPSSVYFILVSSNA